VSQNSLNCKTGNTCRSAIETRLWKLWTARRPRTVLNGPCLLLNMTLLTFLSCIQHRSTEMKLMTSLIAAFGERSHWDRSAKEAISAYRSGHRGNHERYVFAWKLKNVQAKLRQIAQRFAALLLHCLLYNRLLKSREKFRQPYLQFFQALTRRDSRLWRRDSGLARWESRLTRRW